MARGRFLSKSISLSEQVDELIDAEGYEAGVVVTWMIAHLDIEGRMKGSPKGVKGSAVPLREDITLAKIESILTAADKTGLLKWYENDGEKWVWFPKFAEHQQGLRKSREAPSKVPEYSGSTPGVCTEQVPLKVREGKVSKEKRSQETPLSSSQTNPTARSVNDVIANYQTHHPRSRPGDKERKKIRERLKEGYSVPDLCKAIDGCHASAYHCGENDRGKRYQSLDLIMRDADHVTGFIETAQQGDLQPTEPGRKRTYIDATRELLEKADRDELPGIHGADDATTGSLRTPAHGPETVERNNPLLLRGDEET